MMNAVKRPFNSCWLAACLIVLGASHACGQIADVAGAFEKLPTTAASLTFDRGATALPGGGHLQGIQLRFDADARRNVVYLSHDSTTVAYLLVVEFPAELTGEGRLVHALMFPGDGGSPPLRHGGGIQLSGDVLAVGLEDNQQKTRSEIQFWNVARPEQPAQLEHLTIRRSGVPKDKTAGGVGLVQRKADHLLAVANWDSRAIDFYISNGKPLDDAQCRFEFKFRWRDATADKEGWQPDTTFGQYQAINLLVDADENLFLIGPHTVDEKDRVDRFALDLDAQPNKLLRKLASKTIQLPAGNHFRYAAGAWIDRDGLGILSSPRNLGAKTRIGISR